MTLQPHELFHGAWLLDKDGQPFEVTSFLPKSRLGKDKDDYVLCGQYWLSKCSPIELTDKIVNQFDVISGVPEHLHICADIYGYKVMDMIDDEEEFHATHLHNLQRFFNLHYTPITINEQQLREAIK